MIMIVIVVMLRMLVVGAFVMSMLMLGVIMLVVVGRRFRGCRLLALIGGKLTVPLMPMLIGMLLVVGMLLMGFVLAEHDVADLQHRLSSVRLLGQDHSVAVFRNDGWIERRLLTAANCR
jgi:hypothetical protein